MLGYRDIRNLNQEIPIVVVLGRLLGKSYLGMATFEKTLKKGHLRKDGTWEGTLSMRHITTLETILGRFHFLADLVSGKRSPFSARATHGSLNLDVVSLVIRLIVFCCHLLHICLLGYP